ncbi:hypothetical protein AAMO2058_001210300 [Amorphochlora amoebiformis]
MTVRALLQHHEHDNVGLLQQRAEAVTRPCVRSEATGSSLESTTRLQDREELEAINEDRWDNQVAVTGFCWVVRHLSTISFCILTRRISTTGISGNPGN